MNKLYILFLFTPLLIFSQSLTIGSGGNVIIADGATVEVANLALTPSANYTISGANDLTQSSTAVTSNGNSSISQVHATTTTLENYSGVVTLKYDDADLNGITEADLVLELQSSDGSWTSYTPSSIDTDNNAISYDFTSAVTFKAITASSSSATLTITDDDLIDNIRVFPNPTMDYINILSPDTYNAEIFNATGQKLMSTNKNKIDIRFISNGNYFLKLKDSNNNIKTFTIIKK
tara:strand:- start:123 stop:824 length:702 start_codon:yes stop_codon:yes gene_type:complete